MLSTSGSGHATAPAIKVCVCCNRPKINLRKHSTFGIAYSGRLLCRRCVQSHAEKF